MPVHPNCMPGRPRYVDSPRRETWRRYKMKSQCRASGCKNTPMEHGFCGVHDEMLEDGEHFPLKPMPHANKQPLGLVSQQKAAAREAIHEVLAEVKARREARAKR